MKIGKDLLTILLFLLPLYLFLIIMVFFPLFNVLIGSLGVSIFDIIKGREISPTPMGYLKFVNPSEPYLESLIFTIEISLLATLIIIIAGYFFTIFIVLRGYKLTTMFTIPLFTPYIVGAFMWWTLLFPRGYVSTVINGILMSLGVIERPITMVNDPNGIGILFGEVWIRFVIAVMMFYGPISMIPKDLADAARSLGASTWEVVKKVYIPMTKYSIIATSAIILLATMAGVSIPLVLGGSWPQFLNVMIYLDVTKTFNYLMAYVSGVFYLLSSVILGYIFFRFTTRRVIIQVR